MVGCAIQRQRCPPGGIFLMVIWHGGFQRQLKSNLGTRVLEGDNIGGTFGASAVQFAAVPPGLCTPGLHLSGSEPGRWQPTA